LGRDCRVKKGLKGVKDEVDEVEGDIKNIDDKM
jgi:hypothetical protein